MELFRLFLMLSALLIVLFQKVDIRVTKYDRLTAKINFMLFAIVLTDEYPRKRIKLRSSHLRYSIKAIFKSTKYLLSRSGVTISATEGAKQDGQSPIIDISFHFSLFQMIISAMILLYYIVESKIKRMIKNV